MNMHAAYLHVMTDLMFSCGVLLAGVIVWFYPDYSIIDPFVTLGFSFAIITSTLGVLNTVFAVLFEGVPDNIDIDKVRASLLAVEDVSAIHDLHIWAISSERASLSCHVVVTSTGSRVHAGTTTTDILRRVNAVLRELDIDHSTVQIEEDDEVCQPNAHVHCY